MVACQFLNTAQYTSVEMLLWMDAFNAMWLSFTQLFVWKLLLEMNEFYFLCYFSYKVILSHTKTMHTQTTHFFQNCLKFIWFDFFWSTHSFAYIYIFRQLFDDKMNFVKSTQLKYFVYTQMLIIKWNSK